MEWVGAFGSSSNRSRMRQPVPQFQPRRNTDKGALALIVVQGTTG
jgi:hypothetical protein